MSETPAFRDEFSNEKMLLNADPSRKEYWVRITPHRLHISEIVENSCRRTEQRVGRRRDALLIRGFCLIRREGRAENIGLDAQVKQNRFIDKNPPGLSPFFTGSGACTTKGEGVFLSGMSREGGNSLCSFEENIIFFSAFGIDTVHIFRGVPFP